MPSKDNKKKKEKKQSKKAQSSKKAPSSNKAKQSSSKKAPQETTRQETAQQETALVYSGPKASNTTSNVRNERLRYAATHTGADVLSSVESTANGLHESEVAHRRAEFGSNAVTREKKKSLPRRLVEAFINPFSVVLLVLAFVSCLTDIIFPIFYIAGCVPEDTDATTVIIICVMVVLSGAVRFIQETRSGNASAKLLAMISTTCAVVRDGQENEIELDEVVVGDIIRFSAGDIIPADLRILNANDMFVSQAALTGESEPAEKLPEPLDDLESITDASNLAFMGTNVISGSGTGVVVCTGDNTLFGSVTAAAAGEAVETSFSKGVNSVSWVLIRFMLVMVPIVFVINGLTKGDWLSAFLFGISIAVGMTPEMLPMIVTTCLAKGAVAMSKKNTIIKNLNSTQNFGAIDILCTDKTGTLTQDQVVLQYHLDVRGKESERVLRHAYMNSYFQTGYKNLMDFAIIQRNQELEVEHPELGQLSKAYTKVDEIPFDFERRRLSVVVEDTRGKRQMVTKGAIEEMLSICSYAEVKGEVVPLTKDIKKRALTIVDNLNEHGFRVLGLAQKHDPAHPGQLNEDDESDMVLLGYLAFLDPPKPSTTEAIEALSQHGVTTKILTGDNEKVTRTVCQQVGLKIKGMLLGSDIEKMSDDELSRAVEDVQIFAKLAPDQKSRIVSILRGNGHVVGFMGDGINDTAAMRAADIGISVDTAVDVAKESADVILLEKDLMVLEQGIIEGRKTYANMIKYIKMTASSNFGTMFSVVAASALLPFLPMAAVQLVMLSLIYDLSCMAIPWDNVDPEFLKKPRTWESGSIVRFMIWLGPTSSIFDFTTFAFMYFIICPLFVSNGVLFNDLASVYSGDALTQMQTMYIGMFQAGWFVESMWTQTFVIHMLRTPKLPFIQSHASAQVTLLTLAGIVVLTIIPFTPIGTAVGLQPLPWEFFVYLVPCVLLYMGLVTSIKGAYVRHYGELL